MSRTIVVVGDLPSPSPSGGLSLTAPTDGATLSGPVDLTGSAAAGASLTISATLVAAVEPNFEILDPRGVEVPLPATPPAAPDPLTVEAGSDGAFDATLTLLPGSWEISIDDGGGEPVTRRISVTAEPGLHATLRVIGRNLVPGAGRGRRPEAGHLGAERESGYRRRTRRRVAAADPGRQRGRGDADAQRRRPWHDGRIRRGGRVAGEPALMARCVDCRGTRR